MALKNLRSVILSAGLGLHLLAGSVARAEETSKANETFLGKPITEAQKSNLRMLPVLPELYLSYFFLEPLIHESGHALVGKALGVDVEEFHPYSTNGKAYTILDKGGYLKQKPIGRAAINGAGLIFSRTAAESLDAIMNSTESNPFIEQAMAALYFACRFEALQYVAFTAAGNWDKTSEYTGDDIHNLVRFITKDPDRQKWAYVGLGAVLISDLALDYDEVVSNWYRLWMKKPQAGIKKEQSVNIKTSEGGAYVTFTYKF